MPAMLRVITAVLARYQMAEFINNIRINNLALSSGGYCAKGKWNMAHARLARQGVMHA